MNQDPKLSQNIQEIQILEQTLQGILMQKQQIQIEVNEVLNALDELSKNSGDVYKIVGGIMVKSEKSKVTKDLEEKKKILRMKLASFEKQESSIEEKIHKIQQELTSTLKSQK